MWKYQHAKWYAEQIICNIQLSFISTALPIFCPIVNFLVSASSAGLLLLSPGILPALSLPHPNTCCHCSWSTATVSLFLQFTNLTPLTSVSQMRTVCHCGRRGVPGVSCNILEHWNVPRPTAPKHQQMESIRDHGVVFISFANQRHNCTDFEKSESN